MSNTWFAIGWLFLSYVVYSFLWQGFDIRAEDSFPFALIAGVISFALIALGAWLLKKIKPITDNVIAWQWLVIIAFLIFLIWAIFSCSSPNTTATSISTPILQTTATANRPPTITPNPCLLWSEITTQMEGNEVCVYGIVSVHSENLENSLTNIYFGTREQFFLVSTYHWSDPFEGKCVTTIGKVQLNTYKIPYIKFGDSLYNCESWVSGEPPVTVNRSSSAPPQASTPSLSGGKYENASNTAQAEFTEEAQSDQERLRELSRLAESSSGCPDGCKIHPSGCDIKGNISYDTGEKIYHVPGQEFYASTSIDPAYGERWFCTETEALANGWRKAY